MARSITLDDRDEAFIEGQLASGRYDDASHVVREALRLLEERERQRAALDAAIHKGLADVEAGRMHSADEVFDELETELAALPDDAQHA